MRVGYERVSSKSQNLDRQTTILKRDKCKKIFHEKISGATTNRPALHKMLKFIRSGDIVEVVALDRLGRNKDDILKLLRLIKSKGAMIDIANFTMMTAPVRKKHEDINHFKQRQNTYELINSVLIQLLAYVAETERREIKERQKQGIENAKRRGVYKGRPKRFYAENKDVQGAINDFFNRNKNGMSATRIAKIHGMSRSTLYNLLKKYKPHHYEEQFSFQESNDRKKNKETR